MPLPRRAPGTGTILARANGTFAPRLPDGTYLDSAPTYDRAAALLDAAIARLSTTGHRVGVATLRDFGPKVLDLREQRGIADTDTERSRWRLHVEPWLCSSWALQEITAREAREWLDDLALKSPARGNKHGTKRRGRLARSTIQNTLNLLRSVLDEAVVQGKLRANPLTGVELPRGAARTHDAWTYLTPEEQRKLLEGLASNRYRSDGDSPEVRARLVAFAIYTGARQGEQWNLELHDVSDTHVTLRYGSEGRATKGRKIRRVPLMGEARRAVAEQRVYLRGKPNPERLLWPSVRGGRRYEGEPTWWRPAVDAILPPKKRHDRRHVRWHDLRHTCASSLVAGWWCPPWPLMHVRDLLGHKSITTTEIYSHLAPAALDAMAAMVR